jgi:MFS family permease
MAGFAAASVGCALAPNAAILIAARGVQGLGAAIWRGAATATSS